MATLPFAADCCPYGRREAANRVTINCWYQRRCGGCGAGGFGWRAGVKQRFQDAAMRTHPPPPPPPPAPPRPPSPHRPPATNTHNQTNEQHNPERSLSTGLPGRTRASSASSSTQKPPRNSLQLFSCRGDVGASPPHVCTGQDERRCEARRTSTLAASSSSDPSTAGCCSPWLESLAPTTSAPAPLAPRASTMAAALRRPRPSTVRNQPCR